MFRRFLALLVSTSIVFFCFATTALAQGQGHGKGQGKGQGKNKQVVDDRDRDDDRGQAKDDSARSKRRPVFTSGDRRIIYDYFHGGTSNLPPGLAKRGGDLPPGLQKHLARNGTLPPGLQKRLTPFPEDLERRLPRLPDIYRRGTIGDRVVIIDRRTQRIMDVIDAATRP